MPTAFTAAPHHDVLVLIVQTAVLLFVARALGEVAQRLGQPAVVGEILSGILLGPSLVSSLAPGIGAWILPQTEVQGYLLEVIALLGVLFLLLVTGLETDLSLIRRRAGAAVGASLGGIVVPFGTGFLLGWYLPATLLADPDQRLVFALFVATAMSISAIAVIGKVLLDMDLMRRDVGQTIIAAGMTDDAIGWILLSVVVGLAGGGTVTVGSVAGAVGKVVAFILLSLTLGRWIVKRALDYVQDETVSRDGLLTLVVVLTFAWGAITQALDLEAVLGAFFMGILFGQMRRLPNEVAYRLESMTHGIFAPIFFAVAGLKVDFRSLLTPELISITGIVIAVACIGKGVGVYAGARLSGRTDHWTALSLGAGMNARGAMEIIVATVGLSLGILTQEMYSIIVVMALATSLMAPPTLRWTLRRVVPERQELERLERERLDEASPIAGIHRVLVPVRRRPGKAELGPVKQFALERLGADGALSITLLNVALPGRQEEGTQFLEEVDVDSSEPEVTRKVVESTDPAREILEEAQKDYDLLLVGAPEATDVGRVFHPIVDELVRMAPCPTLVVRGEPPSDRWPPRRIIVPADGSRSARAAAEMAFALTKGSRESEVLIVNVVQEAGTFRRVEIGERLIAAGRRLVEDLATLGRSQGVTVRTEVHTGTTVADIVIGAARAGSVDLILLGTDVQVGAGRPFLGPHVEQIFADAPCPVMVINGA